jgi:hypothetical protein
MKLLLYGRPLIRNIEQRVHESSRHVLLSSPLTHARNDAPQHMFVKEIRFVLCKCAATESKRFSLEKKKAQGLATFPHHGCNA